MSAPEIFKKYDHNNNGCLEYNEMVDILRQLQHQFGENFAEVGICVALLLIIRQFLVILYPSSDRCAFTARHPRPCFAVPSQENARDMWLKCVAIQIEVCRDCASLSVDLDASVEGSPN